MTVQVPVAARICIHQSLQFVAEDVGVEFQPSATLLCGLLGLTSAGAAGRPCRQHALKPSRVREPSGAGNYTGMLTGRSHSEPRVQ